MEQVIRLTTVKAKTGLGKTTIYQMMKQGTFPKCVKLGDRAVGWSLTEVSAWIANRMAARDQGKN